MVFARTMDAKRMSFVGVSRHSLKESRQFAPIRSMRCAARAIDRRYLIDYAADQGRVINKRER
jgi:hypothetical protein